MLAAFPTTGEVVGKTKYQIETKLAMAIGTSSAQSAPTFSTLISQR